MTTSPLMMAFGPVCRCLDGPDTPLEVHLGYRATEPGPKAPGAALAMVPLPEAMIAAARICENPDRVDAVAGLLDDVLTELEAGGYTGPVRIVSGLHWATRGKLVDRLATDAGATHAEILAEANGDESDPFFRAGHPQPLVFTYRKDFTAQAHPPLAMASGEGLSEDILRGDLATIAAHRLGESCTPGWLPSRSYPGPRTADLDETDFDREPDSLETDVADTFLGEDAGAPVTAPALPLAEPASRGPAMGRTFMVGFPALVVGLLLLTLAVVPG